MNSNKKKSMKLMAFTAALAITFSAAQISQSVIDGETFITTSAASQSVSAGFHVKGQDILDANGNVFVMRGVNIAHAWYTDKTEQSIKAAAARGTNCVRIVCADGGQWTKTTASELEKIIGWCKENKQVCIVEAHDTTGSNNKADIEKAAEYWTEMKDILNSNTEYVILNIGNEWYGDWNSEPWAEGCKEAIGIIRNAGIKNMIMIDSAGWGQYPKSIGEKGAEVFASDPDKNTVFSAHLYEYAGGTEQMVKDNIDTALSCGAPVVIGEFGYKHTDGDVDEATIMSYCKKNNMGYLAWSWKGNGGSVEFLDLVNDWDGTDLTEWGKIYFDEMKKDVKLASVFNSSSSEQTTTTAVTTTVSEITAVKGDVNLDGSVSASDIVSMMQALVNKIELSEQAELNADMNDDNRVSVVDLIMLKNLFV